MNEKIVIHSTEEEFHKYLINPSNRDTCISVSSFHILCNVEEMYPNQKLRGVFIGTWYHLRDAENIIYRLYSKGNIDQGRYSMLHEILSRYWSVVNHYGDKNIKLLPEEYPAQYSGYIQKYSILC